MAEFEYETVIEEISVAEIPEDIATSLTPDEDIASEEDVYTNASIYDNDSYQTLDVVESGNDFSVMHLLGRISINLILPFINGLMLGFGELFAHEIGFRYNWFGARVCHELSFLFN